MINNSLPSCLALCCVNARHTLLERVLRCFLDQDYEGPHTLVIYNNGQSSEQLDTIDLPENKKVIVINNHIDLVTREPYTNVGSIFRDGLSLCPQHDWVFHFDSDDYMLPCHISKAMNYFRNIEPEAKAYKTYYHFFRYEKNKVRLERNILEPSIFVRMDTLKLYGYLEKNVVYHHGWVNPLIESGELREVNSDPTYVYDWSGEIPVFKISGRPEEDTKNFQDGRMSEQDIGDGIITPWSSERMKKYYDLVGSLA